MDPPISHVITHAVDDIEVSEDGFDVENFGTLSGKVDVHTKKPSVVLEESLEQNVGSFWDIKEFRWEQVEGWEN